jgi:hypothetical protein
MNLSRRTLYHVDVLSFLRKDNRIAYNRLTLLDTAGNLCPSSREFAPVHRFSLRHSQDWGLLHSLRHPLGERASRVLRLVSIDHLGCCAYLLDLTVFPRIVHSGVIWCRRAKLLHQRDDETLYCHHFLGSSPVFVNGLLFSGPVLPTSPLLINIHMLFNSRVSCHCFGSRT